MNIFKKIRFALKFWDEAGPIVNKANRTNAEASMEVIQVAYDRIRIGEETYDKLMSANNLLPYHRMKIKILGEET